MMPPRGGPPRPISGMPLFQGEDLRAAASALAQVRRALAPEERADAYEPSVPPSSFEDEKEEVPAKPTGNIPENIPSPEPRPNSPEDAGFLTPEQRAAPAPGPTMPSPRACKSCPAPIYWAAILDENGQRIRRDDDKGWKSMPVDAEPSPRGNVVLFARPREGVVCRVLRKGETPPPGARLRTSHFSSCPNATHHRKARR